MNRGIGKARAWTPPFVVIGVFLAGILGSAEMVSSEGAKRPTRSYSPYKEYNTRCIGTENELPGQGWLTGFSGGGIYLNANRIILPEEALDFATRLPNGTGNVPIHLAILDTFDSVALEGDPKTRPNILNLSHGALVANHVLRTLNKIGFNAMLQNGIIEADSMSRKIYVDIISIQKDGRGLYKSESAVKAVSEYVSGLRGQSGLIILNMSFILVPCRAIEEYYDFRFAADGKNRGKTFYEFLNSMDGNMAKKYMSSLPNGDPLISWIVENKNSGIVFVAASGNLNGAVNNTWPAALNTVISVGGYNKWSNMGDVSSISGLFSIPYADMKSNQDDLKEYCDTFKLCAMDDISNPQPKNKYEGVGYQGTSFSAPSVATYMAAALARGSKCYDSGSNYLGWKGITKGLKKKFSEIIKTSC